MMMLVVVVMDQHLFKGVVSYALSLSSELISLFFLVLFFSSQYFQQCMTELGLPIC